MKSMALRTGVDKNGGAWVDKHYADIPMNSFRMSEILTNLFIFQQFLCNCRELCTKLGRLPEAEYPVKRCPGQGLQPNPMLGVTRSGEPEAPADSQEENILQQLARLSGHGRVPSVGNIMRTRPASTEFGTGPMPLYANLSMEVVLGHLDPKTSFGPLLKVEPYGRCASSGLIAGIAAFFEHECVPDPARNIHPLG